MKQSQHYRIRNAFIEHEHRREVVHVYILRIHAGVTEQQISLLEYFAFAFSAPRGARKLGHA